MNFQYLEHLEVEFLNSIFKQKDSVFSVRENSAKKSNSYERYNNNFVPHIFDICFSSQYISIVITYHGNR